MPTFHSSVVEYDLATGILHLQHVLHHATRNCSSSSQAVVTAAVDVNILLETVKGTDIQLGEWVNVIGYVRNKREHCSIRNEGASQRGESVRMVHVQAVMLWSAGALKVEAYEQAVASRNVCRQKCFSIFKNMMGTVGLNFNLIRMLSCLPHETWNAQVLIYLLHPESCCISRSVTPAHRLLSTWM